MLPNIYSDIFMLTFSFFNTRRKLFAVREILDLYITIYKIMWIVQEI